MTSKTPRPQVAPHPSITPGQLRALELYALDNGKRWRDALVVAWHHASAPASLHALRNSHGFAWLDAFRFDGDLMMPGPSVAREPIASSGRITAPPAATPLRAELCDIVDAGDALADAVMEHLRGRCPHPVVDAVGMWHAAVSTARKAAR